MNRRDFLRISGLLSTAAVLTLTSGSLAMLPVEAWHRDRLYRGTPDGKIFVSANAGDSWKLLTNFGPEFSIFGLISHASGNLHAHLGFQGYGFDLVLDESEPLWRTPEAKLAS